MIQDTLVILSGRDTARMRDDLAIHLKPQERSRRLTVWHEGLLAPGEPVITANVHLANATVVLVLLSAPFLADEQAMADVERSLSAGIRVVPIIARACNWSHSVFGSLDVLPRNGTPVSLWPDPGLAWNEVAAMLDPTHDSTAAAFAPPNNLPARRLFVGRHLDLEALRAGLAQGRVVGITQHISIYGLGGVGKTSLALEYAHAHAHEYPGGVLWLRAEGNPVSALVAFAKVLQTIAPPRLAALLAAIPRDDGTEMAAGMRLVLQNNPEPSLLVLDNVDSDWCPYLPGGRVSVLLTTRDPELVRGERLRLDVLTRDDAIALASAIAGGCDGEEASARDRVVVTDLGGLAVAVEMAARAVKRWIRSWIRYEGELRRQPSALLDGAPQLAEEYRHGVFAALDFSIAHCSKGTSGSLLISLAALAPDRAPITWVEAGADISSNALDTLRAWEALVETGLVRIDPVAQRVAVHRLVHRRLVDTTAPAIREERVWKIHGVMLSSMRELLEQADTNDIRAIAHHAEVVLSQTGSWPFTASWCAEELWRRGAVAEARDLYMTALKNPSFDGKDPDFAQYFAYDEAECLGNLAAVLTDMGELGAARPFLERAVAVCEREYGRGHHFAVSYLLKLARHHERVGDLTNARAILEGLVANYEGIIDPDPKSLLPILTSLAGVLEMLGDCDRARAVTERALSAAESAYGSDHPIVAMHVLRLLKMVEKNELFRDSDMLFYRALGIAYEHIDSSDPFTASLFHALAHLSMHKAASLMMRAAEIFEKSLGVDHPVSRSLRQELAALCGCPVQMSAEIFVTHMP